ncbi:MAG: CDF family Co(II)/Ni(II) efflux transporter DmeF [Steroidobacteraceae bacterium]
MTERLTHHGCRVAHLLQAVDARAERRTRQVMWLTAVMMVVEIAAGWIFGSMALLADGWHMSSHTLALGLSVGAYALARRYATDPRFAFGSWKIEVLGGYTSAVLLGAVALGMAWASIARLLTPEPIRFDEAIVVAVVGLVVNLVSAWLLAGAGHAHDHAHGDHHDHGHAHGHVAAHDADLNLRSAYLHVATDAATSVFAIVALLGGKFLGATWLDPAMGIVGAVLVASWAVGLIRETARALLDAEMDTPLVAEIHEVLQALPAEVDLQDLHVWRVGRGRYACMLSLQTNVELSADLVRERLAVHEELVHVTVEINRRAA